MCRKGMKKSGIFWKRSLAVCISLLLLTGCAVPGGSDDQTKETSDLAQSGEAATDTEGAEEDKGETSLLNKDVIYRETLLDLQLPMTREMKITSGGGVVYLWGQNWETDSSMNTTIEHIIVCRDPVTGEVSTVYPKEGQVAGSMEGGVGDSVTAFAATPDGELVMLICHKVSWTEKNYQLVKVDSTSKLLWTADVEEMKRGSQVACGDRYVYIVCDNSLLVYDLKTGKSENQIDCSALCGYGIQGIYPALNGQVYIQCRVGDSPYSWDLLPIDVESGQIGEAIDVPWKNHYLSCESGMAVGSEFMMDDETNVSVWSVGEENVTEKINLLDSGIDGSKLWGITAVKDGTFWAIRKDTVDGMGVERICELTKIPPEEVKEKTVMTIGCSSTSALRERILAFNRENTEYQVKVIDYSIYPSYPTNEQVTRLNLDMISEDAPDILYLEGFEGMVDGYIRQGLLEDLNTWIDADPEINRTDYLNNIFEAYEVNGGLYELPTSFIIKTLSADRELVGSEPGLSMAELKQLEKTYSEYRLLGAHTSRNYFLQLMLQFGTAMDTVNGTCSFDSLEFIEILKLVNQIGAGDSSDRRLAIFSNEYLHNFENFRQKEIQHNPQGINYTYIGFPGVGGNGALIEDGTASISFAITSQSECKAGAWAFIRYFLGDEYQNQVATGSVAEFPVKLSALNAQRDAATKPISASGRDEEGEFMVPGLSEARADELMAYLKSLNQTGRMDWEVYNIVLEEAEAYFAGQKSVEEVAKTIQGRVWIYLAEQ